MCLSFCEMRKKRIGGDGSGCIVSTILGSPSVYFFTHNFSTGQRRFNWALAG